MTKTEMRTMKRAFGNVWSPVVVFSFLSAGLAAQGQGTMTFDSFGQHVWSGTNYSESGMIFELVVPQGSSYDNMVIVPPGFGNVPQNTTPFMGWFRQYNPYDYVALRLTNGGTFGLTSVWLADPIAPSLSPVTISFVGFKAGGTIVTNTFTTPGNGATTFQNYQFDPAFASGLSSVAIDAPRWAMDNLVWVPEPSAAVLLGLGLLVVIMRKRGGARDA
jgi:hypothetical protein